MSGDKPVGSASTAAVDEEVDEEEEEDGMDPSTEFVSQEISKCVNGLLSREFLSKTEASLLNSLLRQNG